MTSRSSRQSRGTRVLIAVVTAVAALGVLVPAAGPAYAVTLVQCQGTETVTYDPGVTFTPHDVQLTVSGEFSSCVDGTGQAKSGTYGEQFTISVGCNDLFDDFEGQRVVEWNAGDSSVIEGTGSSTAVAGQVATTFTGTVVQGRFQGEPAVQTITLAQTQLLRCFTTGLTKATGLTTLTIT
ncbi:hypothetical protein [Nonomuraea pusilla]|uniref:Allene oxide cyclase barrel-like domain-containing protein n=1 Tax=Nonomuraea pusilla TaxID=46177 RepID=A0A1H7WWS1_9ACTN|nr:hypothetical protein [Nonomuraea pusilla]SEM26022.1 hypothetical protein SAMN05660976_04647 [Nonomuraea pusilla]